MTAPAGRKDRVGQWGQERQIQVRVPSPKPAGSTEHAQCDYPVLTWACSEVPTSSCTCLGCSCSKGGPGVTG